MHKSCMNSAKNGKSSHSSVSFGTDDLVDFVNLVDVNFPVVLKIVQLLLHGSKLGRGV